jgi:hypothetical protein
MLERLRTTFNSHLEKAIRAEVRLLGRCWPAFQVCGGTGLALALILGLGLASRAGLSPWVVAAVAAAAAVTFLALVMATKIVTGQEQIIYYHHEIAVLAVAALLLWIWGQPVLPYLDITILGMGLFLACGRIGCLMVGCCHGRLSGWGVRYTEEHARAGFTHYYVGARLFPIQAVESLWVLCVVLVGVMMVVSGEPAGAALAWYVVAYDAARFCFEFLRGDPERSHLWGFSQPQWISLLLMCGVAWAELSGVLALRPWHIFATLCIAIAMAVVALKRRFQSTGKYRLLHPNHVREVAGVIEAVSPAAIRETPAFQWTVFPMPESDTIRVGRTSLGLQISAGKPGPATSYVHHYCISWRQGLMTEEQARVITRLILGLKQVEGPSELRQGGLGVFHLLIDPAGRKEVAH